MTFRVRQLSAADHPLVISVIDQWWGGRPMADKLPRRAAASWSARSRHR
jgi:hypothetical protein